MTETVSPAKWQDIIQGATVAVLFAASISGNIPLQNTPTSLLRGSITQNSTASKGEHVPGEFQTWNESQRAHIKSLRGKYKNSLSSSEEFLRLKREEIALEE